MSQDTEQAQSVAQDLYSAVVEAMDALLDKILPEGVDEGSPLARAFTALHAAQERAACVPWIAPND